MGDRDPGDDVLPKTEWTVRIRRTLEQVRTFVVRADSRGDAWAQGEIMCEDGVDPDAWRGVDREEDLLVEGVYERKGGVDGAR